MQAGVVIFYKDKTVKPVAIQVKLHAHLARSLDRYTTGFILAYGLAIEGCIQPGYIPAQVDTRQLVARFGCLAGAIITVVGNAGEQFNKALQGLGSALSAPLGGAAQVDLQPLCRPEAYVHSHQLGIFNGSLVVQLGDKHGGGPGSHPAEQREFKGVRVVSLQRQSGGGPGVVTEDYAAVPGGSPPSFNTANQTYPVAQYHAKVTIVEVGLFTIPGIECFCHFQVVGEVFRHAVAAQGDFVLFPPLVAKVANQLGFPC